nr:DUF262 and DUF1524 domain-containing protein [Mycolicibacterium malmesburyense]CRL76808.1 hypothetical protein CPGR_04098 [Mycolicibacterium malmesburyense]
MKATEAKMLSFLQKSPQFIVPIYQRTYSWTQKECLQLWDDIMRAGGDDDVSAHFVGSIVYVEKGLYSVSSQSPLLVIDGQQRLTTVTLLIEALARTVGPTEPIKGFSATKLRSYYLLNALEEDEARYKLLLSETDKETLLALLEQRPVPPKHSVRVMDNFEMFETMMKDSNVDLATLCRGLAKLVIVDISLDREQDDPQLIFESLNSTGRELSQADLIRNFVLMGLEPHQQTKLYNNYWRPVEDNFGQESYTAYFDGFMRHFLTVKTGEIPNVRAVYESFKQYARSPAVAKAGIEELLADIKSNSRYYCAMALGAETDAELGAAFHDLRELKVDVAYPLLLELYQDYASGVLSKPEFLRCLRLVESYVFRRAICAIPTNSMNRTFAGFAKSLKKDRYVESFEAGFSLLPSYRRFPSDTEFERDIKPRDLYNFRNRSYWLRKMENHDRKERVSVEEYTIEHILPQNENLSAAWREDLGPDWQRIQKEWLHTLGNLTLTGYNSEMSDRPFKEKRDMKGGFADSPLRMNQGLGQLDAWTEGDIRARGDQLATKAITVWTSPALDSSVLDQYRPKAVPTTSTYSLKDHPHLETGPLREVFEAFRREVLSLDPAVSEEILKLYIAFKAETNFADVVPQAKSLRISLNMKFPEINDPKGICRDVTNLGRWGNGDVEFRLSRIDEIPYAIGLVEQSLQSQLGDVSS